MLIEDTRLNRSRLPMDGSVQIWFEALSASRYPTMTNIPSFSVIFLLNLLTDLTWAHYESANGMNTAVIVINRVEMIYHIFVSGSRFHYRVRAMMYSFSSLSKFFYTFTRKLVQKMKLSRRPLQFDFWSWTSWKIRASIAQGVELASTTFSEIITGR